MREGFNDVRLSDGEREAAERIETDRAAEAHLGCQLRQRLLSLIAAPPDSLIKLRAVLL